MTINCCVFVPEGIVLAADSRLTYSKSIINNETGNNENIIYTQSDNAQKVLLLKKVNVGITFCGNALLDGTTISDYIRKFEIEKVCKNDSVEMVANKLVNYCDDRNINFIVCGFKDDIPYVFYIRNGTISRCNIDANSQIAYGAKWDGQITAISKTILAEPKLNINWDLMPLKDAIDLSEFLIDLTIKYERFNDSIQTCGGKIDILVLTKDEPIWIKHKIYN